MCPGGEAQEYRYAGTETGGRMILFIDKTDVGGGGVGAGGGCPPWKGIGRREERARRVKNNCVIIINGA